MQAGLITSSVKPAEKKRQQTVASGMIKYFFDYKDWFTVAVGLPDFCSVSDWKQGQNYLRIALKTLSEQGLLIYANARELPSQLAIQPPPQTGPESTPKPHSFQSGQSQLALSRYLPSPLLLNRYQPENRDEQVLLRWAQQEVARIERELHNDQTRNLVIKTNIDPNAQQRTFIAETARHLQRKVGTLYYFDNTDYIAIVRKALEEERTGVPVDDEGRKRVLGRCIKICEARTQRDAKYGLSQPAFIR
jgi:hypothetical protein